VLRREGKKGEGAEAAAAESRVNKLRVSDSGAGISWTSGDTVTAAVRALGDGGAVVTVRRGRITVRGDGGEEEALLAGETARIERGKAPDKRAAWTGREAPVAHIGEQPRANQSSAPVLRGLGAMTARVPGTSEVIAGVRLLTHKVQVVVRDGFARTEIEEEFQNDTAMVLEGRYTFPLPPDASISRLALWVGPELVEGELLERKRAAAIFQGIVDDTVRPRDPALLEWVSGSEFSLKIFPIPAKGSRKVILAYSQILPAAGGRVRYVYPLSLGADRSTRIDDFAISVKASSAGAKLGDVTTSGYPASISTEEGDITINWSAKSFVPSSDFAVTYAPAPSGEARGAVYSPKDGEFQRKAKKAAGAIAGAAGRAKAAQAEGAGAEEGGFFAVRLAAELPEGAPLPAHVRRDMAVVIDASHSQSRETFEGEVRLAAGLLRQMDADERFVLLACESACEAYPEKGLAEPSDASIEAAERWILQKKPGGSSDVAGSLIDAAGRLDAGGSGQIVYIGDGAATSGELSAGAIAARVKPAMTERKIDLRILGAGRTVDEVTLSGLARALGAVYERIETGDALADRIVDLGVGLRAPVIRALAVEPSPSLRDIYPREIPNLRLGQEVVLLGRLAGDPPASITVRGELTGGPYSLKKAVAWGEGAAAREPGRGNPLVPRLWAEARIRELEASGDEKLTPEVIDLSTRFHVMARPTALLVLENERMFAEFGVERTTLKASDQSDHSFLAGSDASAQEEPSAAPSAAAPASRTPPPSPPKMSQKGIGGGAGKPSPYRCGHWVDSISAFHTVETGDWAKAGEDALEKLRKDASGASSSRRRQITLIRGLIARGRFEEALKVARQFSEADPDLADAHELVAQAAATTGDRSLAMTEVDTQAELNPRRALPHLRAAKAFEAAGDERRACAHWRSVAELTPSADDAVSEALRCRARVMGGRDAALAEARAMEKKGPKVEKLIASLEAGEAPGFQASLPAAAFKASLKCDPGAERAPTVVVLYAGGSVISPWTPGTAAVEAGAIALPFVQDGMYRTLVAGLSGGATCELTVKAHGSVKTIKVSGADALAALRTVTQSEPRFVNTGKCGDFLY
jgi:hypothetical protein